VICPTSEAARKRFFCCKISAGFIHRVREATESKPRIANSRRPLRPQAETIEIEINVRAAVNAVIGQIRPRGLGIHRDDGLLRNGHRSRRELRCAHSRAAGLRDDLAGFQECRTKLGFAPDSLLEGDGFEPSVPQEERFCKQTSSSPPAGKIV
jgi:hypothetical protein